LKKLTDEEKYNQSRLEEGFDIGYRSGIFHGYLLGTIITLLIFNVFS
jgi:hypothetical protein